MGGLARRATYFMESHSDDSQKLKIAGGFEFAHKGVPSVQKDLLAALKQAFEFFDYDFGLLSKTENDAFEQAGIAPPESWKSVEQSPFRVKKLADGKTVGFLFFPSLADGQGVCDEKTLAKLSAQVVSLKSEVDLLVGVCDWGLLGERDYLARASLNMPHILLGSGRGGGVTGDLVAGGKVYYVRAYDRGRTVAEIHVSAWPRGKKEFLWEKGNTISSELIVLNHSFRDDLKIDQLFSNIDLNNH